MTYKITYTSTKTVEVEAKDGKVAHDEFFDKLKAQEDAGEIEEFEILAVEE